MKLIAAVDMRWAIGSRNNLLVQIPDDQKRFREITTGNVVVLGRRTLDGFPGGRPLKNRTNIILSRNPDYAVDNAVCLHSREELFAELQRYPSDEVYVIGGGKIYEMLEPYCDTAYITRIEFKYDADTWFPDLDEKENWEVVEESEEQSYFSLTYRYITYKNNAPLSIFPGKQ